MTTLAIDCLFLQVFFQPTSGVPVQLEARSVAGANRERSHDVLDFERIVIQGANNPFRSTPDECKLVAAATRGGSSQHKVAFIELLKLDALASRMALAGRATTFFTSVGHFSVKPVEGDTNAGEMGYNLLVNPFHGRVNGVMRV
ncbi:hypothetical protein PF010_g32803 [Phytophthora fragariae]|uniref:Uncharacterized protein n=1 Tax=Phytophthora fragariae TaxID=53985 RepID=A0A6G0JE48_9STRA|nr:hypothetical protein PF010_g32803 [Phytophthora fragariae]